MLGEDGSINRLGDGSADCNDGNLYIGITQEKLLDQLRPLLKGEVDELWGSALQATERKGRDCLLKVMIKGEGIETGFQLLYGERSQGPSTGVRQLVIQAVKITDVWHGQQKYMRSSAAAKSKPWWKFWG